VGQVDGSAWWKHGPVTTRLLALAQLVTSPLLLLLFVVAEPPLVPEWGGYVARCIATIFDGRPR